MKETSCGVIICNKNSILICHPSGKSMFAGNWDIPKGHNEKGEDYSTTAIRELYEETGITANKLALIPLGTFDYTKNKNLCLYLCLVDELPIVDHLFCTSVFVDKEGREMQEMDGYKIIDRYKEISYLYPNLQKVFVEVNKAIDTHIKLNSK